MDFHSDSAENEFDAILAEIDKEMGAGDLMGELGCGFTADAQQCKEILSSFAPLREATISRILVNVARTCADLEDNHTTFSTFSLALGCCIPSEPPTPKSWNVDILVDTIKLLVSYLKHHYFFYSMSLILSKTQFSLCIYLFETSVHDYLSFIDGFVKTHLAYLLSVVVHALMILWQHRLLAQAGGK